MSRLPLHIGLTYDLRSEYLARGLSEEETAELDQESTVDALYEALAELGETPERIGHVDQLAQRLSMGERFDLVFNICEGLRGFGRESLVPALLEHHGIPYTFSDPLVMAVTLHKGMSKRLFASLGLPTAPFAVLDSSDVSYLEFGQQRGALQFPCFIKPVGEGTGKGISSASVIRDRAQLAGQANRLWREHRQPLLVENYLPGRELTVGVLGTARGARTVGTLEIVLLEGAEEGAYTYENKEHCEEVVEYRLVSAGEDLVVAEAERLALAAWRGLGCRDGGRVDLRCDARGRPQLLEINPLAGLHPEHSDLPILWRKGGGAYVDLIAQILESAMERCEAGAWSVDLSLLQATGTS